MFASPLIAANSPEGLNLSTLQALDNSQLDQIRGQGWEELLPQGLSLNLRPFSRDNDMAFKLPRIGRMIVDLSSERRRNESDKIKHFFQGMQGKANQINQQFNSVLRIMKDLGRVGVGGSDLGAD
jgi:hypothetical protein